MSRKARLVSSTRYFMDAAEQFKGFARWTDAALLYVLKPLADTLNRVGFRPEVDRGAVRVSQPHYHSGDSDDGQAAIGWLDGLADQPLRVSGVAGRAVVVGRQRRR